MVELDLSSPDARRGFFPRWLFHTALFSMQKHTAEILLGMHVLVDAEFREQVWEHELELARPHLQKRRGARAGRCVRGVSVGAHPLDPRTRRDRREA